MSLEQARNELGLIAGEIERAYPKENESTSVAVLPLRDHNDS